MLQKMQKDCLSGMITRLVEEVNRVPEQPVILQPLTLADIPALMVLQEQIRAALPDPRWYYMESEADMAEELAHGIGLCVRAADGLAAIAICRFGTVSGNEAYALCSEGTSPEETLDFLDIMVRPDYRRRGIHSACIQAFRSLAESNGLRSIYCTIDPENEPCRRSFEKAGFHPVCRKPAYDGRPRIYYRLDLALS